VVVRIDPETAFTTTALIVPGMLSTGASTFGGYPMPMYAETDYSWDESAQELVTNSNVYGATLSSSGDLVFGLCMDVWTGWTDELISATSEEVEAREAAEKRVTRERTDIASSVLFVACYESPAFTESQRRRTAVFLLSLRFSDSY
jgi:hypothetical protein